MIKISSLDKYFNKHRSNEIHVIDNVSLELPDTGIVTFFGPSGCGKTTFLNAVGGLDRYSGTIDYGDEAFNSYNMGKVDKFRLRNIGYVFQGYNLLEDESVYENLRLSLEMLGIVDKDEVEKRIKAALDAVGMYKFRKKKAYALSGGQQQRVAIARALTKNCKILICDEPTGNLDSKNTVQVMNILKKLSRNTLVLLVTHEENIAKNYSDIVVSMKDGRVGDVKGNTDSRNDNGIKNENAFYLRDLNKKSFDDDESSITIYSDKSAEGLGDLTLFIRNNTIYVKSDKNIQVLNSKINVIDGSEQEDTPQTSSDDQVFDASDFSESKGRRPFFKKLGKYILESASTILRREKKGRLMKGALIFVGSLFAIAATIYQTASFDLNLNGYDENYNIICRDQSSISDDARLIERLYESNLIDNVVNWFDTGSYFRVDVGGTYETRGIYSLVAPNILKYDEGNSIVSGSKPTEYNDLVLSASIADTIVEDASKNGCKITYDDIINSTVSVGSMDCVIKGICKDGFRTAYCVNRSYFKLYDYYGGYGGMDAIWASQYAPLYPETYSIVEGHDVNIEDSVDECVVNSELDVSIGETVCLGSKYFTVVGKFIQVFGDPVRFYRDAPIEEDMYNSYYGYEFYSESDFHSLINIVEGSLPSKGQCLVPASSSYSVGDTMPEYQGMTVSGRYVAPMTLMRRALLVSRSDITKTLDIVFAQVCFTVNNFDEARRVVKEAGNDLDIITLHSFNQRLVDRALGSIRQTFVVVFLNLFAMAFVFTYFLMRSRLLASIYRIGVLRELGESRLSIYLRNLVDSMVVMLFTVMLGYIIMLIGINLVVGGLLSIIGVSMNVYPLILVGIMVYVGTSFLGTIPTLILLSKTPSEISHKYDI